MLPHRTNHSALVIATVVCFCLLALAEIQSARAGGISFDLNEPPPPEDEYLVGGNVVEDEEEPPTASLQPPPPLSCPAAPSSNGNRAGGSKLEREQSVAANLRKQFDIFMRKNPAARAALQTKEMPDYCDYEKFKRQHEEFLRADDRRDPAEQMFRRSLYLKRCLDVFRSRVQYRLGKKSYLEGVTPLADMSSNEVGQLFMSAPPMEFLRSAESEQQYKREVREQRLALKEYDLELPPQATAAADESGDALELRRMSQEPATGARFERDSMLVMDSKSVKTVIADMLSKSNPDEEQTAADSAEEAVDDETYRLAIRQELIGAELEHKSEACANFDEEGHTLPPYPTDHWPLSDKRPEGRVTGKLPAEQADRAYVAPDLSAWRRQYLDWSHHRCFHKIYKQFPNCGCCYVVAAVNLAEFVSCTASGQEAGIVLRRFSEMHVLNCALKYHPHNMGCAGGSVLETLRFIGQAGAYTRRAWRERVGESARAKEFTDLRDVNCPMTRDLPWQEWGREQVLLNPVVVHPNEWLEALEDGPLVATVQMPRDGIVTYSGGVHDGESCVGSGIWHVMVLVGYGLDEHGRAYWRFRNSFGPEWGDQGHFNLAMSVPSDCFAGGVRVYREPVDL